MVRHRLPRRRSAPGTVGRDRYDLIGIRQRQATATVKAGRMRYRALGNSGLTVSVVGLGCNNFGSMLDLAGSRAVVDAAIDCGITLLDTADVYGGGGGSEELLGEALAGRRDRVVLATKFGHRAGDMGYGHAAGAKGGRSYVRRAAEESLRRLRTDYLGNSNFTGWQIAEAACLADRRAAVPFVSAQNHWSLLERAAEAEVVPAARHFGLGVLPYFPLANGLLTGKIRRGQPAREGTRLAGREGYVTEAKLDIVEALAAWGEAHGVSLLAIAIACLAEQPGCGSVIAGAMSPEQVKANADAADWIPTAQEVAEVDAITLGLAGAELSATG